MLFFTIRYDVSAVEWGVNIILMAPAVTRQTEGEGLREKLAKIMNGYEVAYGQLDQSIRKRVDEV